MVVLEVPGHHRVKVRCTIERRRDASRAFLEAVPQAGLVAWEVSSL